MFSASSRLATRHRPAPSARRIAISRCRALARARTRFAVLPHTASNSSSMMICRIASDVPIIRCGPRGDFQYGSTSPCIVRLDAGIRQRELPHRLVQVGLRLRGASRRA